jgi:DNA-binding response OmpR family regulator
MHTPMQIERSYSVREDEACILLVDDDPDYLWLLKNHLQLRGYKVLAAGNGIDALEQAAAQKPDILVLDVQMPGLDGYTVCQRFREFSRVPVIMLSGLSAPTALVQGRDAGADDYLIKPVPIDELVSRVSALLRRDETSTQPEIAPAESQTQYSYLSPAHP